MEDNKMINLDEARQSLESTQKTATNIGERVKEVAYMSDKMNHDRIISEILSAPDLTTSDRIKMFDHEQKLYQRRQKANAKVSGKMQDKQTKNTVLATIGWCVVFFCVGGTVVAICPAARTFVTNSIKQIGKAAAA